MKETYTTWNVLEEHGDKPHMTSRHFCCRQQRPIFGVLRQVRVAPTAFASVAMVHSDTGKEWIRLVSGQYQCDTKSKVCFI